MHISVTLDDNLVEEAQRLTGLTQRKDLIQEGLKALIARESARRLARLGCSEPPSGAESADVPIAGEDPARTAQWQHLLSLRDDPIADGMHLMDWDEINAEVRRRQGGAADE
ncbi:MULTISPECIES: type II toxin-antitoxin system VapB family antitoxin [unclassified Thiocapsa]|uniref:type II toxin-antitoxin system VapB family antitoxin n=1 Tax=unclassified Thiocapsa TaxID=2641286 RepID=UPI0035B3BA63